jgi:hypothetical protein
VGFGVTLAGVISVMSLAIAVGSFWRAYQRDRKGDERQWEQRIRALEDRMLQLNHYATARIEVPSRLTDVEYRLEHLYESVKRLEAKGDL